MSNKTIKTALTLGAATAGMAAWNARLGRQPALGPAMEADWDTYDWDGGRVGYYHGGEGLPVLLLHCHNAAASAYEMRRAFPELINWGYRVYAPDLPGYGRSERKAREYFAQTYVRFLHDFVHDVIGEPAIVIASSVSAAHAFLAMDEDAHAFTHLVAVSPTGLSTDMIAAPAPMRGLGAAARLPVWGQSLFNAIASEKYIRHYLETFVYHNPWNVTYEMVDYAWLSAHQPNARYAPAAFLGGQLWTDVRAAYADVRRPLMLVWGDHDRINPHEKSASVMELNQDARLSIIENAGATPHDEQPAAFAEAVLAFLKETESVTGP